MRNLGSISLLIAALAGATAPAAAQDQALASLAEAARAGRTNVDAQSAYGFALLRAGKFREAQRALAAAQRLDRNEPARLFDVARVAFAGGEYRAARNACRPLARFADSPYGHVCQARAFLVWNRSARAFEELEAALAQDANHFEALYALGEAHRLRAAVTEAESAYQRASSARPESALPYLGLGRLYAAAGRRDDAVRALRTADAKRELEGGSARPEAGHPIIAYELGMLLGGSDGATLLRRAVAGRLGWPEAQVALGDSLLASGDTDGAKAAFGEAIRVSRNLVDAHVGLGRALTAAGDHAAAATELERALALVENHPGAVLAQAQLAEARGANEEAFALYQRAADLDQRGAEPLLAAARLALAGNRDVLAVGFLDRVLTAHPNRAAALELYGDAMAARRDRARAQQYYERALSGTGQVERTRIQQKIRALAGNTPRRRR